MWGDPHSSCFHDAQLDFDRKGVDLCGPVLTCLLAAGVGMAVAAHLNRKMLHKGGEHLLSNGRVLLTSARLSAQKKLGGDGVATKEGTMTVIDPGEGPATDQTKAAAVGALQKGLVPNQKAILFVYAPWCGHCTQIKPSVQKAANEGPRKIVAANSQHLPDAMLRGEEAIGSMGKLPEVTHFPFFVLFDGKKLTVPK